jgi:hypothetical protein
VSTLYIDDAEPAHRKADVFFNEESLIVGAAMHNAAIHARQRITLDAPVTIFEEDSADSTHIEKLFLRSP